MTMPRHILLSLALACACACAPRAVPAQVTTTENATGDELPVGKGQLSQDNITVRLRNGTLDIRVVPLDERVLRLLSTDGYTSLHGLVASQRRRIDSIAASRGVRRPGVALVSFHSLAPATRFDPQLLSLSLRNRLYRPIGVLSLTPTFSAQQLDAGGAATGLFIYEEELPVTEPFTVGYLEASTDDWERRLPRLETERGRILGTRRTATDSTRP
jgi:hypothetical protein